MSRPEFIIPIAVIGAFSACICLSAEPSGTPATAPAPAGKVVYSNGFENGLAGEWSTTRTTTAPKDGRKFLGQFADETVSLTVRQLPPHRLLQVSFELLVIRDWTGSHRNWGPDVWELAVAGGPTLLRSTFSNVDFYAGCRQSFPDWIGIAEYAPGTGAAEANSLGYAFKGAPEIGTRVLDSVYRLNLTFPHTRPDVTLTFSASGLGKDGSGTWGIDNVHVAVLPDFMLPGKDAMKKMWDDLAAEDAARGSAAAWALIAAGEPTVDFILEQVAPVVADPVRIASLVRQLNARDWRLREEATEALVGIGMGAEKPLKEALQQLAPNGDLEMRLRLKYVLEKIEQKAVSPEDERQYLRARCVLAVINSPNARKLLENLPAHPEGAQPGRQQGSEVPPDDESMPD